MALVLPMISADERLAHSLALREQEHDDAEFARKLADEVRIDEDAAFARQLAASAGGIDSSLGGFEQDTIAADVMKALYVPCEIGAHEVEMLVDTGAEMSVISETLARQLNLLDRLDRRYQGMARGVGSAKILGKVFDVPVKLGHVEFELNFSVVQQDTIGLILGLDLMRHFKCLVDIERNRLVFGGAGGVEVPFLASLRGRAAPVSAALVQGHRAAELLRARDPVAARSTLQTVGKLLRNIAAQPAEQKFRRLQSSNQRLQREVLAHPEAMELLRLAGFVLEGDALVLPSPTPLDSLKQLISASFLQS
eukprot:TRINITY_DN2431_c0_g1_i1.p1 TRINITY_DN2431_c0_g1~~TRINITY_DN2431_c0_g1_i1.p1  ORF type:complete len:327 (+),score=84.23 TRINITY_DN2431_c0_g1_i1:56-982(+)